MKNQLVHSCDFSYESGWVMRQFWDSEETEKVRRGRVRMKGRDKWKLAEAGAYFTVEAALIIPVVLCIFVMIIYLSFYLYDRCVLAQDCYVLSYRQSIEKGRADRAGGAAVKDQFGQKLFMLSSMQTEKSEGRKIRVKVNAAMQPPLFGLDFFRENRYWSLEAAESAQKTDPPRDYRKVRRLLNLASRAGGHSEGEEK